MWKYPYTQQMLRHAPVLPISHVEEAKVARFTCVSIIQYSTDFSPPRASFFSYYVLKMVTGAVRGHEKQHHDERYSRENKIDLDCKSRVPDATRAPDVRCQTATFKNISMTRGFSQHARTNSTRGWCTSRLFEIHPGMMRNNEE